MRHKIQDNMPSSSEENNCDSPYSPTSDDFSMNNLYNPSTLLDPKLEVLDSNTPLFFTTPQQTPTRELQPSAQTDHVHQSVFNTMPTIGDLRQQSLNNFMSPPFSQGITSFTQSGVNYLDFMNGSDNSMINTYSFRETSVASSQSDRSCQMQDISDKGLQIRVLGVPQTGAKSRVETQIKLCLQLVTDKGEKVPLWSHLRLPEYMVAKEKLKTKNARNPPDHAMNISEKGVLNLEATVVCASDIPKKVLTCLGCVQRERKRSQRKKENKNAKVNSSTAPSADDTNKPMDLDDEKTMQLEQRKILLFNCSEIVDFSSGDTILPTRITCYCRHHNEKVGFCIYFVMKDYTNTVIANGMSPPIMITDDHKSSKTKIGVGRKRPRAEYDRRASTTSNNSTNSIKNKVNERHAISLSNSISSEQPTSSSTSEPSGGPSSPVAIVPTQNSGLIPPQSTIKHEKNSNLRQLQVQPSFGFNSSSSPTSPISQISPVTPITPITPITSNVPNTSSTPNQSYQQLDQSANLATSSSQVNFPVVNNNATSNVMMNMSMAPTSINSMNSIYQTAPLHQSLGAPRFTSHQGGGPMRLHHNPNSMMRRAFYNTSGNSIYQNGTISGYPLPRISRLIPSEGPTYGGVEVTILGSNFIEGLTCVFGETPALPTQYWSPNTLVCVLPPAPTPGPVVVSFKECPLTLMDNSEEVVFFTYTDDSDRALMELALQVVGMKMTGKLEDARNIAMRIVGGNDNNNNNSGHSNCNGNMNGMHNHIASLALQTGENNFEAHIITTIGLLDVLETEHNSISLQNRQQHTMLHIAAMLGYTRLCSVLIDKGIDLNLQDKYGFTALHYAAWTGKDDVVRLLMRVGSGDITPNFNDQYAIDLAISRNFDDIVTLINDYRLHDSGVSLSPSSSEDSSLGESDEDSCSEEDFNEDSERRPERNLEKTSGSEKNKIRPNISWVDSITANDLLQNNLDEDDGIVNAEVVEDDKKNVKQPFSEMATDLASASTIWLQKTFAHMHMPNISKPSQINIPYIKMPNLQMPNLQIPNLQNFSSPKFSTMTFGTNLSIPRPSIPSMPSLNMNIEFPTLPVVTFPTIIPGGFSSFVWDEKSGLLRQSQPPQSDQQKDNTGFSKFGYSWPFNGSQQPVVPMYHHELEEPRAPSPSINTSRVSRKVGYDFGELNEEQIARMEHHEEKYRRLKKDRMLYLFWVPVLFVMVALAIVQYSPYRQVIYNYYFVG
ncbi:unnamed protein product [Rhizophagus irregularis]|uniref:Mga2p n=5 Tax=Rhizophagus irregularis TaxID=588596 RepID=A0A015JBQ5_RHIIW|nr:Mga2p [Rhizophagus irregularis DAOM 197198w]CAB4489647.1 unnamed protein product [Rhizophagus irregularis]CAB5186467.1 unnamed protein product [Rhizophagus irregularis]